MHIQLDHISKRFGFEWIFKQVSYNFEAGKRYAIVGPNGSGKSTLLKIIAGGMVPTSGKVQYILPHKRATDVDQVTPMMAYAAPYISLIEDYTPEELYHFHASFKPMRTQSAAEFLSLAELDMHRKKYIKHFSSGMRQRLKLAFAFLTQTPVILLDEPTSNFDAKAIGWYQYMLDVYAPHRLVIIGSNQEYEYESCPEQLDILKFKGE